MRVLLVGETWITHATHLKGWDSFTTTTFHSGADEFLRLFDGTGVEIEQLAAHAAAASFPASPAELDAWDVVLLSDIGANTLLLHPETWLEGRPAANRLRVLADWVESGGGLAMAGGYMSFQGINGTAGYRGTPVEDVLPVELEAGDDRVEVPEGFRPELVASDHPILSGIGDDWPLLLGYNRLRLKADSSMLLRRGEDPLLAVCEVGAGRALAWASDIGPHWCPADFSSWHGFRLLWSQALRWLANDDERKA